MYFLGFIIKYSFFVAFAEMAAKKMSDMKLYEAVRA